MKPYHNISYLMLVWPVAEEVHSPLLVTPSTFMLITTLLYIYMYTTRQSSYDDGHCHSTLYAYEFIDGAAAVPRLGSFVKEIA